MGGFFDDLLFHQNRTADGALAALRQAGFVAAGRFAGQHLRGVTVLIVFDLHHAGVVREILFADGAVPVGHVAGGQAGGRFGRDFRQLMGGIIAVNRAAVVADSFRLTCGRTAAALHGDSVVFGFRGAAGAGFGVSAVVVGIPAAVDMAAFGEVIAL